MVFVSLELDEAQDIAVRRFRDNWTGTPLTNVLVVGQDNSTVNGGQDPWVRISVQETGGGQQSLGAPTERKYRREFSVFVQIYTLAASGVKGGSVLAAEARRIYEGLSFDGLDFQNARIFPQVPEEKWLVTLVEAEGEFDEIK